MFRELVVSSWSRTVESVHSGNIELIVGIIVILSIFSLRSRKGDLNITNAPTYGYRSILEPKWLLQLRFVTGARDIISSGYQQFKDVPFILRRFDTDYNILPARYLSEIAAISPSILSGVSATADNMLYEWTDLHFLHYSNLHVQVMKRELSPKLSKYLEWAAEEVNYAWHIDVPEADDWVEVDIQEVVRKLVARMSARIFLGQSAARDEDWINVSVDFTIDAFTTAFVLRMVPTWMRPLVARFLPARYRLKKYRDKAAEIVKVKMDKHANMRRIPKFGEETEQTLMDWMIDHASPKEGELHEMAHRQLILTLASIHTTSTNTAIFLYELCKHPEWTSILRKEIEEVNDKHEDLSKVDIRLWHPRLERMDSFLLECFRLHPPILLSPQRTALQAYTLKDGTHIPKGCRIAFANGELQMDPETTPDPTAFDPMRSYRKRHSSEQEYYRSQAVLTDIDSNLTFGYGNQACPGRFLGVAEIKFLLAKLLSEYDFKYPDGKTLPATLSADENVFMEPGAKLMMKKRA
ncbi:unnamed protein product [Clonostachys byssicola]|uniref:Cytochrome P450 n=1 Tax=Clonostachys byssicola TaxID=160290 RepID=A0A9N9UB30_9HYPO|nr:unnamed protein product [Clonostachys byssicola]